MSDGRIFGYARVSTDDQDLSLQLDALGQHGGRQDLTFTDKLSGAKSERPGLDMCLNVLKPGDTLAVWRLDRLGRSMRHLVTLIEDLRERGIEFRSISDGMIDTTSQAGGERARAQEGQRAGVNYICFRLVYPDSGRHRALPVSARPSREIAIAVFHTPRWSRRRSAQLTHDRP